MALLGLISGVLGVDEKVLDEDSSMKTLRAWNSSRHVELVMALEERYQIQFSTAEMVSLQSVGRIREALKRHGVVE